MALRYRIIAPRSNLPISETRVVPITTDPITINAIARWNAIILDYALEVDAGTATIAINEEPTFDITTSVAETNTHIESIVITGITNGDLILHVLDINLLKRLNQIEIR